MQKSNFKQFMLRSLQLKVHLQRMLHFSPFNTTELLLFPTIPLRFSASVRTIFCYLMSFRRSIQSVNPKLLLRHTHTAASHQPSYALSVYLAPDDNTNTPSSSINAPSNLSGIVLLTDCAATHILLTHVPQMEKSYQ